MRRRTWPSSPEALNAAYHRGANVPGPRTRRRPGHRMRQAVICGRRTALITGRTKEPGRWPKFTADHWLRHRTGLADGRGDLCRTPSGGGTGARSGPGRGGGPGPRRKDLHLGKRPASQACYTSPVTRAIANVDAATAPAPGHQHPGVGSQAAIGTLAGSARPRSGNATSPSSVGDRGRGGQARSM
jgi:hypothetical protein